MGKQIFLHAGAHRTGTSSFQLCLDHNRAVLDRLGVDVAYPGRDGAPRGRLILRLPRPGMKASDRPKFIGSVRDAVDAFSPNAARALVLSDENIPGRMLHFYEGRFFPASEQRLVAMRDGLGDADITLLYVIRPYDALFQSAYRKRAEDRPMDPFETITPRFVAMDRGWPDVIEEMRAILRPVRFLVARYESRGSSRALLARFPPIGTKAELVEPPMRMNVSATDAALRALQARYWAGETLPRRVWKRVIAAHADATEPDGFAAFDAAARARLQERYARDLDRIAALSGLELI